MYWESYLETLNNEELEALQVKRLNNTIESAMNSPYYRELFREKNIFSGSIKDITQVQDLPFTTKQDL